MSELVFSPPTPDTPGFFKRNKQALEFIKSLDGHEYEPESIDKIIEFLLPYVKQPEDREEAKIILMEEATENQYRDLLGKLVGGATNPTRAKHKK